MPKAGLQFQKKDEYMTPKEVVDFFGPFDYDPATTKEQAEHLGIPNYDTIETDGLKADWTQYHSIWINPPFTKKFEFLYKLMMSLSLPNHIRTVCVLLPIETLTTKRFHEIVKEPFNLIVPNGRIKFDDGSGKCSSPAFGSAILVFGSGQDNKILKWRLYGKANS